MSTTSSGRGRSLDLIAISERLRALNPSLSSIRAEPARKPGTDVRVVVETTKAELAAAKGQLNLADPALDGMQIETVILMKDLKPGERRRLRMTPNPDSLLRPPTRGRQKFDA